MASNEREEVDFGQTYYFSERDKSAGPWGRRIDRIFSQDLELKIEAGGFTWTKDGKKTISYTWDMIDGDFVSYNRSTRRDQYVIGFNIKSIGPTPRWQKFGRAFGYEAFLVGYWQGRRKQIIEIMNEFLNHHRKQKRDEERRAAIAMNLGEANLG